MTKKKIFLIVIGVLVAIQLYRPAGRNPEEDPSRTVKSSMMMPSDVEHIFTKSCNDCHSYRTTWPWYSKIAPVSWFIASDVNDGRRHLNFSDWGRYTPERVQNKLGEICDEVEHGEMPLKQYTWLHKGTSLSENERQAVCFWTKMEQARITKMTGVKVPERPKGGMHAEDKK